MVLTAQYVKRKVHVLNQIHVEKLVVTQVIKMMAGVIVLITMKPVVMMVVTAVHLPVLLVLMIVQYTVVTVKIV